jgi:hypothetical protein
MGVNSLHHAPATLLPGKNPRIQLIGDVVGPRSGHEGFGEEGKKFLFLLKFDKMEILDIDQHACMIWAKKL